MFECLDSSVSAETPQDLVLKQIAEFKELYPSFTPQQSVEHRLMELIERIERNASKNKKYFDHSFLLKQHLNVLRRLLAINKYSLPRDLFKAGVRIRSELEKFEPYVHDVDGGPISAYQIQPINSASSTAILPAFTQSRQVVDLVVQQYKEPEIDCMSYIKSFFMY